jgi:hypothetical protein
MALAASDAGLDSFRPPIGPSYDNTFQGWCVTVRPVDVVRQCASGLKTAVDLLLGKKSPRRPKIFKLAQGASNFRLFALRAQLSNRIQQ